MKKLLPLLSILLFSCGGCMQTQAPYEYLQGPGGQQMVACYDNSGTRFLMDYLLFQSLMGNGGYGGVMGYYHQYPSRVTVYNTSYSSWHSFNGRSYGPSSYRGYSRPSASSYQSTRTTSTPSTYKPSSTTRSAGSSQPGSVRPSTYRPSSTYRSSSPSRSSGSSYHSSSSSSSSGRRR